MRDAGGGRIVNIASTASVQAWAMQAVYGASKGAVALLTKCMAIELAAHGITVNAIGPGTIETPLAEHFLADPRMRANELGRAPLGRLGTPEDIAAAVRFLARDARWMTGQVMYVDGGFLAAGLTMAPGRRDATSTARADGSRTRRRARPRLGRQRRDRPRDRARLPGRRRARRGRGAGAGRPRRPLRRARAPATASYRSPPTSATPSRSTRCAGARRSTALGGLDVLIANATANREGRSDEDYRASFDVDLMQAVRLVEAVRARRPGAPLSVVCTSSIVGKSGDTPEHAYGAMKAALLAFTKNAAVTFGPEGMRVNAVAPGAILFEAAGGTACATAIPTRFARTLATIPRGQMGAPEEVADVVCFLASPRAAHVNGATVLVDGGEYKGYA